MSNKDLLESESYTRKASSNDIIHVNPLNLFFPPPHDAPLSCTVMITNCSPSPIAFKVKTTAPRKYTVRPSQSICQPGEKAPVIVMLIEHASGMHPFAQDKFMIQAVTVRQDADLKNLWLSISKKQICKKRLRCYFSHPKAIDTSSSTDEIFTYVVATPLEDGGDHLTSQDERFSSQSLEKIDFETSQISPRSDENDSIAQTRQVESLPRQDEFQAPSSAPSSTSTTPAAMTQAPSSSDLLPTQDTTTSTPSTAPSAASSIGHAQITEKPTSPPSMQQFGTLSKSARPVISYQNISSFSVMTWMIIFISFLLGLLIGLNIKIM